MSNLSLPFDGDAADVQSRIDRRDQAGRARAVDPRFNVALEASAGTGKTRVLVDRYVNLLRAGVDPSNILAMTFTRKAAAEMRERILATLRLAAERGEIPKARWRELRDRTGDIAISTIDAFCLSLLREFPLEADLDPGFTMADDTEVPRLVDESLDRALRICREVGRQDEHVALVFAQLGDRRARHGLAALLSRRILAPGVLARFLARPHGELTVARAAQRGAQALIDVFASMADEPFDAAAALPGASPALDGLRNFAMSGPSQPAFMVLVRQLERIADTLEQEGGPDPAAVHAAFARAREYFLTQDGSPRGRLQHPKTLFASVAQWQRHRDFVIGAGSGIANAFAGYRRDLNVLVSRGVWRMYRIAETEYRRTLDAHAVLDFPDLLLQTLGLLRRMEEFARSRYRLESRYHHVLVDEFQDTSRAQWELIALLVQSWGEGVGLAHDALPPSIFVVGDRKQSIYAFRDADVSVMAQAARYLEGLRPDGDVRRSISRSFRAVPALLAFVNDLCRDIEKAPERPDAFRYDEEDRFPVDTVPERANALAVVVGATPEACADACASEIARLIDARTTVRDVETGVARAIQAGDVAILFRTRESHRAFEDALERKGIPAYVYKGLGFFDADEIRDILALLWHLADPVSTLRTAAWLRSGFVRVSDEGLRRIAAHLPHVLTSATADSALAMLGADDARTVALARTASARWRGLVDRIPAAELLDLALSESGYAVELRGPRSRQARENLKKIRGLVRRAQNKGYATLGRIVAYLDRLAVGDESNASIDAQNAVSLMTIHAAKGLEFPVVFVVNLSRGTGGGGGAIRVASSEDEEDVSVSVGDFQSRFDEDRPAREREETKRLLYVALTRARDRLYLSTPLVDGVLDRAPGSLAEVLPAALGAQFAAAVSDDVIAWTSSGGRHTLRVCGRSAALHTTGQAAASAAVPVDDGLPAASEPDDREPLGPLAIVRDDGPAVAQSSTEYERQRLRGTLLHRMVQRVGLGADVISGPAMAVEALRQLIRDEERQQIDDADALLADVADAHARLVRRPDLRALLEDGEAYHEVPFTLRTDDRVVRGTIDCLVRHRLAGIFDGPSAVTVLELKTGGRSAEHQAQLALYQRAAGALFPGDRIDTMLIYLDERP